MKRIYFEEIQDLRHNTWPFVTLLALMLVALYPGLHFLYWRSHLWGELDVHLKDEAALTATSVFVVLILALAIAIMFMTRLHLIIGDQGIRYRYPPSYPKWSMVSREDISEYSIGKKQVNPVQALRKKRFEKDTIMNVQGKTFLILVLKNGHKVQIGSKNRDGLEWAMKKLISYSEVR